FGLLWGGGGTGVRELRLLRGAGWRAVARGNAGGADHCAEGVERSGADVAAGGGRLYPAVWAGEDYSNVGRKPVARDFGRGAGSVVDLRIVEVGGNGVCDGVVSGV